MDIKVGKSSGMLCCEDDSCIGDKSLPLGHGDDKGCTNLIVMICTSLYSFSLTVLTELEPINKLFFCNLIDLLPVTVLISDRCFCSSIDSTSFSADDR